MKITTIFGTGYVDFVIGTSFAEMGIIVICSDAKKNKWIINGVILFESKLDILVAKNYKEGRFNFSTSLDDSIKDRQHLFSNVIIHSTEDVLNKKTKYEPMLCLPPVFS